MAYDHEAGVLVIGGGVTGLAAGLASRGVVLEKEPAPGGLARCSTKNGYTFGYSGHWLFGGSIAMRVFIASLVRCGMATRDARVLLDGHLVPAPIQGHIDRLPDPARVYAELASRPQVQSVAFGDWLMDTFGPTLYHLFFGPFNEKYTQGLMHSVTPMSQRNPVAPLETLLRGGRLPVYNEQFMFVTGGTQKLVDALASHCLVRCDAEVYSIDIKERIVRTKEAGDWKYHTLISALPLQVLLHLAGERPMHLPHLSSLCVNLGVRSVMPVSQWCYIPASPPRFHRIGNYTAVDESLSPSTRQSLYLDATYIPGKEEPYSLADQCVRDAEACGLVSGIEEVDIKGPVEVGYTFTGPGDRREIVDRLAVLAVRGVHSIGGYGRWSYQGMMADMEEGLMVGTIAGRMTQ